MSRPATAPSIRAMTDLATPMAIRVGATLSLVEHAGGAGATAEQLAAATGTAAPALRRLLDHLVTIGAFDVDEESGRYRPTDLGAQMGEHSVEGIKPLLEFWADLDAEPELRRSFDAQMNWRFTVQAPQIAERYDWSRFSEILDVGGGDGMVLAAILHAHPGVRGRVLELAPTAAAAARRFAAAGLDDRAATTVRSFLDPCPPAPTRCSSATSCTTGTTTTPARSWPAVAGQRHRTAPSW